MREKVALVVSRKFNAGHYSHAVATQKLLSESGWSAYLYMHPKFKRTDCQTDGRILISCRQAWGVRPVDLLVIWFPSLRALTDIVLARVLFGASIVYVFHEPFESIRSYLNAGFGIRQTFRICLVSVVSYCMVRLSHRIMLSSRKAECTFRTQYAGTRKKFGVVPLLFDDESSCQRPRSERKYISYVGTIAPDHAFEEFLSFVVRSCDLDWFPGYHYLIATSSSLTTAQEAAARPLRDSGRLVVRQGRYLSNQEINDCFADSIVVWNAYKRSMQSGVLPKCYMFGTPVLVATSNQSEYFVDHQNGVLIDENYAAEQIREAISEIIERFAEYSSQCRKRFLESFYYKGQAGAFMKLVTS